MAKRRKKKSSRKTARAGAGTVRRGRGRPSALSIASMMEIKAEIGRRVNMLEQRREELAAELNQIDSDIAELQGFSASNGAGGGARKAHPAAGRGRPAASSAAAPRGARGRRRARNGQSLADALKDVLTGTTMSVTEMADAVQKAGYKTKSAGNFRTIVNQTLIRDPKTFKRVGRGQYTVKG